MKLYAYLFTALLIISLTLGVIYFVSNLPCREWLGRPEETGFVMVGDDAASYIFGDDGFRAWSVYVCVYDIQQHDKYSDVVIGFFDKYWRSNKYVMRVGNNEGKVGICKDGGSGNRCSTENHQSIGQVLSAGNKINAYLVVDDKANYTLPNDLNIDSYSSFLKKIQNALLSHTDFPRSKDNVIYASQVNLKIY